MVTAHMTFKPLLPFSFGVVSEQMQTISVTAEAEKVSEELMLARIAIERTLCTNYEGSVQELNRSFEIAMNERDMLQAENNRLRQTIEMMGGTPK